MRYRTMKKDWFKYEGHDSALKQHQDGENTDFTQLTEIYKWTGDIMISRWFAGNDEDAALVTMWPWNTLEEDLFLRPSVRTPPCRDGGSSGGWKNTIWSLLQRALGLHIIYILFGKAAFWNPSALSSQWHHQRHVWDKSMQQEESGNQWLLFMIRDSAFVIKILKNKVFERMKSCVLHKYLHQKRK